MSSTVLRRAVNGLIGLFGGKRTQNVFSPFASNRCRPPASGGFVKAQSASGHARLAPREPPAVGPIFKAVRGMTAINGAALKPLVTPLTGYAARHDFRPSVVAVDGSVETQNAFSAVASKSNLCRPPASDEFVATQSAAHFAWPELQGTVGGRHVIRTVQEGAFFNGEPKSSGAAPLKSSVTAPSKPSADAPSKPNDTVPSKPSSGPPSKTSIPRHVPPGPSVAIIGFGRLGKCLLGLAVKDNVNVVAIIDPYIDMKSMKRTVETELAKATVMGEVTIEGDKIRINDKLIRVCYEKNPENINWRQLGAEYIIDSTENCTDLASRMKLISPGGAKKVIITQPSDDVETFFKGLNFEEYHMTMSVVSNGSCADQCAAPLMNIVNKNFVIDSCSAGSAVVSFTTEDYVIHNVNDSGSDVGDSSTKMRTIIRNANPTPKPRILSVAYMKLQFWVTRIVTFDVVMSLIHEEVMRDNSAITAYKGSYKLDIHRFETSRYSAIVDVNHISVKDNCITIGAWYNTVTGFASRALDLVNHMKKVDDENHDV